MGLPDESVLQCPHCGTLLNVAELRCGFCGRSLRRQWDAVLNGLLWLVKAYRIWSLGVFVFAVIHLLRIGAFTSYFAFFFVVLPFGTALAIAFWKGDAVSRWIVAFLILIDLGVILAPEHRILPMLNMFPEIPRTQNRILSWYFLVYVALQFVVVPPVVFFRSLRTAWSGGKPALATWISFFGLTVWSLFVLILVLAGISAGR